MARVKFSFSDAIRCLQETEHGKEATMYGHLRDVFIQVLGYPASDVDIDTTGEDGRPDVTLRAPSGLIDKMGRPKKIPWIVVEAKDERAVFSDPDKREDIFAEKAKYIGTNTGWFVMVDPTTFVARRVGGRDGWIDISVDLANIRDEIHFLELFSALKCDIAGVSDQLGRF